MILTILLVDLSYKVYVCKPDNFRQCSDKIFSWDCFFKLNENLY